MQNLSRVVTVLGLTMSLGIAMPVFAESAPVYDADMMQQQFESADSAQDYPPPPAPSMAQNDMQESGFVPMQPAETPPAVVVSAAPSAVPQQAPSGPPLSMEQRMRRLEQVMQTSDNSSRIETMQTEIQTLRGQVEQLTHQLEVAQTQQKALYADIDKRLADQTPSAPVAAPAISATPAVIPAVTKSARKASKSVKSKSADSASPIGEAVSATLAATATKASSTQPNVAEEQQIYQTAYNLIKAKKYSDAVNALQNMLRKYPTGQFASNAHYWLGELYGLMGKNDKALTEFSTVVKTYSSSPRVSDAQLKVGLILATQMKWSDAKGAFKKVVNRYPGTTSARLALEQLKQIKQAGH